MNNIVFMIKNNSIINVNYVDDVVMAFGELSPRLSLSSFSVRAWCVF